MLFIDGVLLEKLSDEARQSPRFKHNFNIHPTLSYPCHRLLNAVEPSFYCVPHKHQDPTKDETLILLRGRLGIILFDDSGNVKTHRTLGIHDSVMGVDIQHGEYHSVVSLEPGTVFLESKAGPYVPIAELEKANWAPPEGSRYVSSYLSGLRRLFENI